MVKKTLLKLGIKDLIPYEFNNKKHSKEQIDLIVNSIKENGYIGPIIVDENNIILAGHGRLEALKKLGYEQVEVLRVEGLTEIQKKKYRILDNRLADLAEYDLDNLKIELEELGDEDLNELFKDFDIDFDVEEGFDLNEEKEDEVPEEDGEIIVQYGDIFKLGDHYLMCGDSTKKEDVEKLLNGEKIDMVFTDPPYGVNYSDKNEFLNSIDEGNRIQRKIQNDDLQGEELLEFLIKVFENIKENLAEYNSYYITAPQGGDLLFVFMQALELSGLGIRHMLIWNKNNHVLSRLDYHYKHEPILYGWYGKHKFYGKGKYTKSVWDIPKPLKSDLHPTMKPVELIENAVLNSTEKGMKVLDLFGGSGSTLIACEKTNRKCYMMEYEPHYIQVIIKRYYNYTNGQKEIKCFNRDLDLSLILNDGK